MKKSILTIGLFSLVMILTSFTTPSNDIIGGQSTGNMKLDIMEVISRWKYEVDMWWQAPGGNEIRYVEVNQQVEI
jgi:hypothetical protein